MIETYDNQSRVEWCEYIVYRVDNYTEDVFIHVNKDIYQITKSNKEYVRELMVKEIERLKSMDE